jgi:hypothetical protein
VNLAARERRERKRKIRPWPRCPSNQGNPTNTQHPTPRHPGSEKIEYRKQFPLSAGLHYLFSVFQHFSFLAFCFLALLA